MSVTTVIPSLTLTARASNYMHLPIQEGFNWSEAFDTMPAGEWYLVVFRSRHFASNDESLLHQLDTRAVDEAKSAPGFMLYFAGSPCPDGHCLSFCLWESAEHAREASRRPAHFKAASIAPDAYEYYTLERHVVTKSGDGALNIQQQTVKH